MCCHISDLAVSDYHLFRSMQNSLNGKIFNEVDDVKSRLMQYFKNQKFYEHGIMKLPEIWQRRQKRTIPNLII